MRVPLYMLLQKRKHINVKQLELMSINYFLLVKKTNIANFTIIDHCGRSVLLFKLFIVNKFYK